MTQIFCQQRSLKARWNLMTPGAYTQVELFDDATVQYTTADGSTPPAPDVIRGGVPATTLAGAATFDNGDLWAIFTVAGSGALSLVLRAQVDSLDTALPGGSRWALLGLVRASWVDPLDLGAAGAVGTGLLPMAHNDAIVGTRREISLNDTADVVVTAADDPANNKVDYSFALSPADKAALTSNVTCTAYWADGAGTRALSLWSGGANTAPPPNWQTVGFNEASWPAPVAAGPAHGAWASAVPASATEQILLREHIGTPDALPVSITITLTCDGTVQACYWNGAAVAISGAGGAASVAVSTLNQAGPNVLAVQAQAGASTHASIVAEVVICTTPDLSKGLPIKLARNDVVFATRREISINEGNGIAILAADDPANDKGDYTLSFVPGTKGDLWYFDGTLWRRLAIGNEGDVLVTHLQLPHWNSGVFSSGILPPPPDQFYASSIPALIAPEYSIALSLWNGTSNAPLPPGWDQPGSTFNWQGAAQSGPNNHAPAITIWSANPVTGHGQISLFRQSFTIPAGTVIQSAAITSQGGTVAQMTLNGTSLFSNSPGAALPTPLAVSPSLLVVGGENVMAIEMVDLSPLAGTVPYMWWTLDVTPANNAGPLRVPNGATRGCLLVYDGTTWTLLQPGTTGQSLKMQANGLPGWQ